MRWESLSMRERAKLMNTYLRSGVTRLSDMRDHYNKFTDGGEVDNIQSTPAQDFIASWLSNRQEQFKENFRNSGSTMVPYSVLPKSWSNKAAFKEYQNQLKNLRTVKQYDVLGNTKFPHVPESEFEAIKRLSNHTGGAYNPSSHSISYISPYAGTDVHELTHSLNADPQINTIRYGFEGDKLQEGKQYNSYKDSADEIYARLMQFRYLNKLDPKKKYTVEDIKKWREKYDDTDIINRYSDEYLLHLLNNVASTKSSLEKDGRKLAAYGGPLRNEYDNPDQYYDYKTAEEVGNMYDPGTQHWASRDPRTGMILKNPKHPTFGMAIREDMASGYSPYIDSSTGRYFTLSPEEYATSPYKPTLRRVNSFNDGGKLSSTWDSNYIRKNRGNLDYLYNQHRRSGLTHNQAIALMSNYIVESGADPHMQQIGGGSGEGLIQFTDPSRKASLKEFQPIHDFDGVLDPELQRQARYITTNVAGLKRGEWRHGGKSNGFDTAREAKESFFNNSKSLTDLVEIISENYVRPGKPHLDRRKEVATYLNKEYYDNPISKIFRNY